MLNQDQVWTARVMSRQRYEKEIEEILERSGESTPELPRRGSEDSPPPRRRSPNPGRGRTVRVSSLKFQYPLIAGIALILIGAIFSWHYFFFAGLALVVAGYVIYYRAPRGERGLSRSPRKWRGRSMDQDDPPGQWRGR